MLFEILALGLAATFSTFLNALPACGFD